jgi:hypothetical protein
VIISYLSLKIAHNLAWKTGICFPTRTQMFQFARSPVTTTDTNTEGVFWIVFLEVNLSEREACYLSLSSATFMNAWNLSHMHCVRSVVLTMLYKLLW